MGAIMILCTLNSSQSSALFGTPEARTPKPDVTIIGQTPDCSQFLVLSTTAYPQLVPVNEVPMGFDFTYCQQWGLTINADVVARVIQDLRAKAYPPMSNYLDGIVKNDTAQIETYLSACLAVKQAYPK